MRLISNGLRSWKSSLKGDLRASISVAFISIPLGLGIGLASGVPPMAAVIPAVVGGLLFAWFGGGNVTVHSTPKMLIGVTAVAVVSLGGDDLFQGYRLLLAAVVVAGIIQFLLGILRLGVIGDLVPASVIKSLMASVGIIIIVKQVPVLIGSHMHPESIIDLFRSLPEVFKDLNPLIALVGFLSLAIMFVHQRIEFPMVKAIPAAVWVIILSISYSYWFDIQAGGELLGSTFGPEFLINLPARITDAIVHPDFSIWKTSTFWNLVVSIAIISSIEGILSAKAIDRLDPLKRRSNVNKELRVVGLATTFSGFIGGLPVIPGIVPSSVGVSHNGKSPLMDIFQALWVLVLVVVLGAQLRHIPLAALAGILIHTGYKLVNPTEVYNTFKIGWDQVIIFMVTLITTLTTDLIIGISVGVLVTIIIHIIRLKSVVKLLTILFRPNVVTYQENDAENAFHISVKGYVNFLNYPRLKKALDVIPSDARLNLDLSLTEFIDHTVLEHLAEFEANHIRRGGEFEIIGMDTHLTASRHPLATRFKSDRSNIELNERTLTSRQRKLMALAQEKGLEFDLSIQRSAYEFERFRLFRFKTMDRSYNTISGQLNGCAVNIQDLDFHEGEFQMKVNLKTTAARILLDRPIPEFTIEREYLLDRLAALAGYDNIDFENFKNFSNRFRLKGANEEAVRAFFHSDIIQFLEEECHYRLESIGNQVLLLGKERPMSESEIRNLIEFIGKLTPFLTR